MSIMDNEKNDLSLKRALMESMNDDPQIQKYTIDPPSMSDAEFIRQKRLARFNAT